jgi:ribosome-binding protein aMBF1 (putative translation factor)
MLRKKRNKKGRRADVLRDLDEWIGDDKVMRRGISAAGLHVDVAQVVYDARTGLGWSQTTLAERAGTRQSVISRIEDSDYHGHSLGLLHRIAYAMGLEVEIRFSKRRRVFGPPAVQPKLGRSSARRRATAQDTRAVSGARRKTR